MTSKQPRVTDSGAPAIWTFWEPWVDSTIKIPSWGSPGRTEKLRQSFKEEPLLAGAISSMLKKAVTLDWALTGGRNQVIKYQDLLANAENGEGWSYFLSRWLEDYFVSDMGGCIEISRDGALGPVQGLYNLDAATLTLTGDWSSPLQYKPLIGKAAKPIKFRRIDYARIVDAPSPSEKKFGLGFSAVSRVIRAAKTITALYRYEEEKLSDMPLSGVAAITGMTMPDVLKAFELYDESRKSNSQLTFKGVLWLASQVSPLSNVAVNLTSFAGLPEGFNKTECMNLYAYTVALDIGVDPREFWPSSQTGATKAEAEIQHRKAEGKGVGAMMVNVERALNWSVLPQGITFAFDYKLGEEDLKRFTLYREMIAVANELVSLGVMTVEESKTYLAQEGVLPTWLAGAAQEGRSGYPLEKASGEVVRISRDGTVDVLRSGVRYFIT